MYEAEFPQSDDMIYLNHAGVSPWARRTAAAITRFAEANVRDGARHYPAWLDVEKRLRERLARLIQAPAVDDIALVKNTSEGLSFVAYGLDWRQGDAVVINKHEFPSNRVVWESLAQRFGVEVRDVDLNAAESPEDALLAAMDDKVRLLSVSSVQYGTGLRMDLPRLAEGCRRHGALFCVDAIQSLGALRFDAAALEADFVIADGHKWMMGPEGIGLFYSRRQARDQLRLTQFGWHMVAQVGDYDREDWEVAPSARRFECGSPNMLGIHGLEASLSLLEEIGLDVVEERVLENARHLRRRVESHPQLELVTPQAHAGIVTLRRKGHDSAIIHRELTEQGVVCARRAGGIRFSPHFYNTAAQLDEALERVLAVSTH